MANNVYTHVNIKSRDGYNGRFRCQIVIFILTHGRTHIIITCCYHMSEHASFSVCMMNWIGLCVCVGGGGGGGGGGVSIYGGSRENNISCTLPALLERIISCSSFVCNSCLLSRSCLL